jgi:N utilization substance protein B
MLNRRLIRIKTFQVLFGEFGQDNSRPNIIASNVKKSIRGLGTNFLGILAFGPELSHFISTEHNPSDFKFTTTEDDLKSFKIFTENPFFTALTENEKMAAYMVKPTMDWQTDRDIMFIIYKLVKESDIYKELMANELTFENQAAFATYIYKYMVLNSVEFEQLMEEHNIYYYDEKIPMLKSLEKVLEHYTDKQTITIPKLFKNEVEDLQMADDLVSLFFEHRTEVEESIGQYTPGWDSERITKIDYMLMMMALIEFKYMPMIPVKVTLNEYIEIAKMYSTPKSSKFLNGTLDKILQDWKTKGIINKKGRGLIG